MNVLLVSAGGFQGLSLLQTLRFSGEVRVLVADSYAEHVTASFADEAFQVPPLADKSAFMEAISKICQDARVDLVFPCTQRELLVLAQMAQTGALGATRLACCPRALLERLLDKQKLYDWLAAHGLKHLPPIEIRDVSPSGLPLFLKPRVGWGGTDTRIVSTAEELARARTDLTVSQHVAQRYLADASEISADFAIDWKGSISPIVLRARTRVSGGFAVISDSIRDDEAACIALQCAEALRSDGGAGLFNLQVLVSDQQYYLSDLNPRFGTSAGFSLGLGFSLPLFLCASLNPEIQWERPTEHGARMIRMVRHLEQQCVPHVRALADCQALLLDLDDTLLDHKTWIATKLALTYDALSDRLGVPRQKFLEAGISLLEHGQKKYLLDELSHALQLGPPARDELLSAYRSVTPSSSSPYPDVVPALKELRRMGLSIGLLTDNPPDSQRAKLRVSGLEHAFDQVLFSRELGAEKPALETFLEACRRVGKRREQTCMVGDDFLRDVLGSQRAGLNTPFLIKRDGALTSSSPALFRAAQDPSEPIQAYVPVRSLREVVAALRYARRPN